MSLAANRALLGDVALEQRVALGDTLPSVEDYFKRRMGTSAVTVCLAMTEYEIYETRVLGSTHQSQVLLWHGATSTSHAESRNEAALGSNERHHLHVSRQRLDKWTETAGVFDRV